MQLMDSCNPAVQNLATAINKLRKENRRLRKALNQHVARAFTEAEIATWLEMGCPASFRNVDVDDMRVALDYFKVS